MVEWIVWLYAVSILFIGIPAFTYVGLSDKRTNIKVIAFIFGIGNFFAFLFVLQNSP